MTTQTEPWYVTADWWVAIGTVVLAIITGVLAWFTYKLFKATKEARADSLKALNIAADNASLTKESMHRTLRAYVIMDAVKAVGGSGYPLPRQITESIKNTGQTPAHDVQLWLNLAIVSKHFHPSEIPDLTGKQPFLVGVIGKDQTRNMELNVPSGHSMDKNILLTGVIKYLDLLSTEKRITQFSLVWTLESRGFETIRELPNQVT